MSFFEFLRENKRYNLMVVFFAPHGRTHQFALPVRKLAVYFSLLAVCTLWVLGSFYCVYELANSNRALSKQLETSRGQLFTMQLRYENVIEKAYTASNTLPTASSVAAAKAAAAGETIKGKQRIVAPAPEKRAYFSVVPVVQIAATGAGAAVQPSPGAADAADEASMTEGPADREQGAPSGGDGLIKLAGSARKVGDLIKIDYSIQKLGQDRQVAKGFVWAYAVFTNGKKEADYQVVPHRIIFKPGTDEPQDFSDGYSFKVNRMKRGKLGIALIGESEHTLEHVVVVAVDQNGHRLAKEVFAIQ